MKEIIMVNQMTVSLLIVMGTLFLFFLLLKKIKDSKIMHNKMIQVLSVIAVGQKEKVMLLEVHNQKILIGITSQSIQTLLELHTVDVSKNIKPSSNSKNEMLYNFETLLKRESTHESAKA